MQGEEAPPAEVVGKEASVWRYYASLVDTDLFQCWRVCLRVLFNVDNIVTVCMHLRMQTIFAIEHANISHVSMGLVLQNASYWHGSESEEADYW